MTQIESTPGKRQYAWDINPDKLKRAEKEAADRKAQSGGGELVFLKIEDGDNTFRILPGWWGMDETHPKFGDLPFHEVHSWNSIPPDNVSFTDALRTFPEKARDMGFVDPIQAAVDRLIERGVVQDFKGLDGKPYRKTTIYCNAYDRKKKLVGILPLPYGVYTTILPTISRWALGGEDDEGIEVPPVNVFSPYDGCDLEIKKSGKQLETKYNPQFSSRQTPLTRDDARMDELLSQIKALDKIFGYPSDKKVAEMAVAAEKMYKWHLAKRGVVGEESASSYQSIKSRPQGSTTKEAQQQFAKGIRPCFGNWQAGHRYCFDCPQEERCSDQKKKIGPNPDAKSPTQAMADDEAA